MKMILLYIRLYILKNYHRIARGSAQNESRVAQIPAGALLWLRRRRAAAFVMQCSVGAAPGPDSARRALFFLRPNLGIEVGAAEDNLKPKENTDAKISHSNLICVHHDLS